MTANFPIWVKINGIDLGFSVQVKHLRNDGLHAAKLLDLFTNFGVKTKYFHFGSQFKLAGVEIYRGAKLSIDSYSNA